MKIDCTKCKQKMFFWFLFRTKNKSSKLNGNLTKTKKKEKKMKFDKSTHAIHTQTKVRLIKADPGTVVLMVTKKLVDLCRSFELQLLLFVVA